MTSLDAILSQLEKGIEAEMEHTHDRSLSNEIARDHLAEFPDYYDKNAKQKAQRYADKINKKIAKLNIIEVKKG